DWYQNYRIDPRTGALTPNGFSKCANRYRRQFDNYKSEMDARLSNHDKYEKQAAAEVVSKKSDLPNVSSGENAGFIRRIARNTVQHTPNVQILNQFDDESIFGHMARFMLKTK